MRDFGRLASRGVTDSLPAGQGCPLAAGLPRVRQEPTREQVLEPLAIARREQVYMRTAAYLLAVKRVSEATQLRGLYP